jgi:hypothetical protein
MIKLIYPEKVKFDTYNIFEDKGSNTKRWCLTLSFHNLTSLQEIRKLYVREDGFFNKKYKDNINILFINEQDCSSRIIKCGSILLDELYEEELKLRFIVDKIDFIDDPKESISYIRDIKINKIFNESN